MKQIFYRTFLFLLLCNLLSALSTDAMFMSPQSAGRLPEIRNALEQMPAISIANVSYVSGGYNYILYNFTIKTIYNNGKQKGEISVQEQIKISGGNIQVFCQFNYSKNGASRIIGYGYGSITTDSVVYTKQLIQVDKPYEWKLKELQPIKSSKTFLLKRLQPYTPQDFSAIQKMLHGTQQVTPQNVGNQILKQLNVLLPTPLNNVLNHEVFDIDIQYKYYHPTKGNMILNLTHQNYAFSVRPNQGAAYIFKTAIKGYSGDICPNSQAPAKHLDWNVYGGHQTIHMSCLYEAIVNYMQQQGWLNTELNSQWDVKEFQFFAGDLYNIVGNLQANGIQPKSPIKGQCTAQKDIIFKQDPDRKSSYKMTNYFQCYLQALSNKTSAFIKFIKFNATVDFIIEVLARQTDLQFHMLDADVVRLNSQTNPQYPVLDGLFALFKADKVVRKMIGSDVFGTGFVMRDNLLPATSVREGHAIFYDLSYVRNLRQNIYSDN